MATRETLYERPLRKPLDDEARKAIESVFLRRKGEIPVATTFAWHPTRPEFTVTSSVATAVVEFTEAQRLVVNAELGFAARMLATEGNRAAASRFIDSVVAEAGV